VATIKPVEPDAQKGRYIVMQGVNRFIEKGLHAEAADSPPGVAFRIRRWKNTLPCPHSWCVFIFAKGEIARTVDQQNCHDGGKAGIRRFGNFSSDPIGAPEKPVC
jgi:hypothetical protein